MFSLFSDVRPLSFSWALKNVVYVEIIYKSYVLYDDTVFAV